MFGKLVAGIATTGVMMGALATGVAAAPVSSPTASPAGQHQGQRAEKKDRFGGTVTAISDTQLTVRNRRGDSKTFLRTDKTQVFRGKDRASWSEIEVNSHVVVRFEERDGKLYAKRVNLTRPHVAGKVESRDGNVITIALKDGKDVKVTVNSDTKYFEGRGKGNRKAGSLSDIHAGEHLIAVGSWDKSGAFDASAILYWSKDAR
jgi:uncharacterized protein DUF5666